MDYLVRAMAAGGQIRAFAATTRGLTEEARARHNLSPVATAALGRLMTGGTMMGAMMKGERDVLTVRIDCSGPIGGLTVTADSRGQVKGFVKNPEVMLPPKADGHLDVGNALGMGVISVIKDLGLKEPYVGDTILQTGEIAEDLTYYFAASEQIPSAVGLGVLMNRDNTVKQSGGFILQLLPFATEETIAALEERIKNIPSVTEMLEDGKTPEGILETLLGDMELSVTDRIDCSFSCGCSKEHFRKGISCLSTEEIESLLADDKPIEAVCQFCSSKYEYTPSELREILAAKRPSSAVSESGEN